MEINPIDARAYELLEGREDGQLVQIVIKAANGVLDYATLRAATQELLNHYRPVVSDVDPKPAVDALVAAQKSSGRSVTDEYLARLSVAYEQLAPHGRAVSSRLANEMRLSVNTVKGHIVRARNEGFLTPAEPGKEGGQATAKALDLIR